MLHVASSGLGAWSLTCMKFSMVIAVGCGILIGGSVVEALFILTGRSRSSTAVAIACVPPTALACAGTIQFFIVQPHEIGVSALLAACLCRGTASVLLAAAAASEDRTADENSHDWAARTHAHQGASLSSFVTMSWLWPILRAGLQRQLGPGDAPQLHPADAATAPLNMHMHRSLPSQQPNTSITAHLIRALWAHFGWQWLRLGAMAGTTVLLGFAQPLLLSALLEAIQGEGGQEDEHYWRVLGYAAAMPLVSLVSALVGTVFNYSVARLQVRVRFSLVPAVFRASVASLPQERVSFASGKITDLFSVDVQQIMDLVSSSHQLWTLPLQVAVTLFLLYQQVHWAFAAGAAVLAVFIPINMVIARRIGALTQDMMTARDARLAAMGELLNGILGVKQLAWEMLCVMRVALARAEEMRFLGARKYLDAMCVYLWAATPVLVSLATFAALLWLSRGGVEGGNTGLSPSKVFTAVTLLNQLIFPLNAYAWVVTGVLQAVVSFRRVAALLVAATPPPSTHTGAHHHQETPGIAHIAGGFAWPVAKQVPSKTANRPPTKGAPSDRAAEQSGEPNAHEDAPTAAWLLAVPHRLVLQAGSAVLLLGPVGAGKSALLRALAGLMVQKADAGGVQYATSARCVYAPGQPWIRRQSLRVNVTEQGDALAAAAPPQVAGAPSQVTRECVLQAVMEAVSFEEDLCTFEAGLDTSVSLQRLSGGQAARIGLARALFAAWWLAVCDPSAQVLLLLDDPIASLDSDTASSVLQHAVMGASARAAGFEHVLTQVCVVIATHSPAAAQVISAHVTISASGVVGGCVSSSTSPGDAEVSPQATAGCAASGTQLEGDSNPVPVIAAAAGTSSDKSPAETDGEARAAGGVTCAVLAAYLKAAGWGTIALLAVSMLIMQLTRNGADWWLSQWTSAEAASAAHHTQHGTNETLPGGVGGDSAPWAHADGSASWQPGKFLLVFAIIGGVNTAATFFRSFLFAQAGLHAAVETHTGLLSRVVAAPMAWFHATPVGRVVNRFSADQYAVDEALPFQSNILLAQAFGIVGTLVVLAASTSGVFLYFTPTLAAAYWYIQHVYRSSISRELRRLDSVTRSPLFSRFEECSALESPGLAILQADHNSVSCRVLGADGAFLSQQMACLAQELHLNQRMTFANMAGAQWLGVRLQGMGVCVLFIIAMSAALQFIWAASASDSSLGAASAGGTAASAGLALAYALPIVGSLQGLIAAFAATEQESISVERIHEYASVESEDSTAGTPPPHSGPEGGCMSTAFRAACTNTELHTPHTCNTLSTMCARQHSPQPVSLDTRLLHAAKGLLGVAGGGGWDAHAAITISSRRPKRGGIDDLQQPLLATELPPSPALSQRSGGQLSLVRGGANDYPPMREIELVLDGLSVSYAAEGSTTRPLALDLSSYVLRIPPGSRVAVTGRTGSGKSTLIAALWRLTPAPVSGCITINGRDILHMPLWEIRSSMSYLPQTPVLLSGTVRDNLDPWQEYSDAQCVGALQAAFGVDSDTAFGLHSSVGAGGGGLSSGTRQLLALARVLLEARPLVALDEASAAVDAESERHIVSVLAALPKHVTLIVIAHRLESAAAMQAHLQLSQGKLTGPIPEQPKR